MPATNSTTEILEQWLYGRPKRTQEEYLRDVTSALTHMGNPSLETLTLSDLQRYQLHLIEVRHLKHSSVRRKMAALRSLLRFAQEQGYIDRNPAPALRSPKDTSSLHERILTRAQMTAIIAAAPAGKSHAALRLLYATGARASELCGLLWKDCLPRADGSVVVRLLGKGDKWRSVTVAAEAWAEVAALRSGAPDGAKVFGLSRQQLHEVFKAAAIAAGCPDASCHWARHSLATHLIEAGMPLAAVRDLLGHSSVAVTNAYIHSNPDQSASDYLSL
ncbi:MAG TPA: tyrosine-type recombinase/integrase [Nodosilinea sp.]|nr:tyrosine-type recombinase/integrase [Nodosilinea sp.]